MRGQGPVAQLEADYETASQEWEASEDKDLWDQTTGDGLLRPTRSANPVSRRARSAEAGTRGATTG
jgi:hypothetical protein